jgi:hypothetical protein
VLSSPPPCPKKLCHFCCTVSDIRTVSSI